MLNTVKLIDDTITSLNLKGGLSSLVPKIKLNSSKKYLYDHKDVIGLISGMSNEYITKPLHLLDLYEENFESSEYRPESKEDLILDKLDEIRKEIEIIKNEKKKVRLGFSFNINNNELIVQGLRISFSRARKQIPILHVISSDIEKKKWELDEIIEFMGEHSFDKNEMIKWNKYLQQHTRSINDKVKMQGFNGNFLEYKDRALIINI